MATLNQLHALGQSTWLNYLRNSFIRSGELAERLKQGVQGVTANAQVYELSVSYTHLDVYKRQLQWSPPSASRFQPR